MGKVGTRRAVISVLTGGAAALSAFTAVPGTSASATAATATVSHHGLACPPSAIATGYSDALLRTTARTPTTLTGTTLAGQVTGNATLEGLTITPDGSTIIAAMEGALSGGVSASGDATLHGFLVYTADRHGAWTLEKQIAYRTDAGMRVPEVAAYSNDAFWSRRPRSPRRPATRSTSSR